MAAEMQYFSTCNTSALSIQPAKIHVNDLSLPQLCSRLGCLSNDPPAIAMSLQLHA
jgi:hypothetical protein